MFTDVQISFKVPDYAAFLLDVLRNQNEDIGFDINIENNVLTLYSDLRDFPDMTDDGNWEDYEDFLKGRE